ncbi:MAG: hypothetical protein KDC42_11325 [Ignavibacteriae bacterium]|nr:hypothetical protein [Ignavibacteriota bacterium]
MKTLFSILLIIFFKTSLFAQVSVTLQQPPPFQFHTENMWKVTLNNSGGAVDVYLFGTVEKQGQRLVDGTTSVFNLPAGVKKVNAQELSPIDIEKYSDEIENTLNSTGTFQSGVYNICVYVKDASTNIVLGSFCNDYQIINATKSELISPNDRDDVLEIFPVFNWLPPTPIPSGRKLTYKFLLTEILDKQSAYFAVQSNPLLYSQDNLRVTQLQYPLAARQLKPGRRYAWQVITYVDGNMFSESEIWEFKYTPVNSPPNTHDPGISMMEMLGSNDTHDRMSSGMENKADKIKPIEFTGSYRLEGSHNSRQGNGSEVPTNLGSFKLDPSVRLYGIPFNLNVFLDTQQEEDKQNINTVSFDFRPDELTNILRHRAEDNEKVSGVMRVLSYFNTLGIGETYPDYSPNTLSGTRLRGVDLTFNPGLFYMALSGLRNLDPVPDKTFSRNIFAGKIGIGSTENSHFHFTVLKGSDDQNSIDINNVPDGTAPQENILIGTEGKLNLFKDMLTIEGEAVGSMLTRDKTSPDLVSEDFPSFLKDILSPKVSSQFDFMYRIGSKFVYDKTGTSVEAGFKYYGPGFISLGAPNLRNGVAGLNFKLKQSLDERRIKVGLDVQRSENNIGGLNNFTETTLKLGFNLALNYKDVPFVIIDYRPNKISNDATVDSLKVNSSANVLTFLTGINAISNRYVNSINLLVTSQDVSSSRGTGDYSLISFSLNDVLSFTKIPLSLGGSLGFTFTNADSNSTLFNGDVYLTYVVDEIWSSTLGTNYFNEKNKNNRVGIYYSSSLDFMNVIDFIFDAQFNLYNETVYYYGDYNEFLFRAGISKSW